MSSKLTAFMGGSSHVFVGNADGHLRAETGQRLR